MRLRQMYIHLYFRWFNLWNAVTDEAGSRAARPGSLHTFDALFRLLPRRDPRPRADILGDRPRVTWDRKKTNAPRGDWWACCPFHGEKTPSFHCEDKKGRYHCFGCGVSGDHFRFLTELEGLSFPEAVERVAGMAGVPMPARDEREEQREKERASLTDVMEMATRFFQDQLQSAVGAKARAYLRERGLTPPRSRPSASAMRPTAATR
jgi:hypothetical protein